VKQSRDEAVPQAQWLRGLSEAVAKPTGVQRERLFEMSTTHQIALWGTHHIVCVRKDVIGNAEHAAEQELTSTAGALVLAVSDAAAPRVPRIQCRDILTLNFRRADQYAD
jgi:hypothetical protein